MSFKDKVVIVTGGASGIGAASAIAFAKEGGTVVIVDRNETKLKIVSEKIAATGQEHLALTANVTNDEDCKRIIQSTVDKFGKLDVLLNNAGIISHDAIIGGSVMEVYDVTMNTNIRSVVLLTTLAAPHLIKTKGNIVNIASICAWNANKLHHAYSMSKVAVSHFTKGAAAELAASGVRVNAVSPGPVRTDIIGSLHSTWDDYAANTALKRYSEPEEIADLILFLASDKAKGITGSDYLSDNGILL